MPPIASAVTRGAGRAEDTRTYASMNVIEGK